MNDSETDLDLGMAGGAEQNAFGGFCPYLGPGARHATKGQVKRLGRRIEVMELQGGLAARVAAQDAPSAGLGDQRPLDAPAMGAHLATAAPHAAKGTAAFEDMQRQPVTAALELHGASTLAECGSGGRAVAGLPGEEAVSREGTPDHGGRAVEPGGDGRYREPLFDEIAQILAAGRRTATVLRGTVRLEAVTLQPVTDGRRAPSHTFRYPGE